MMIRRAAMMSRSFRTCDILIMSMDNVFLCSLMNVKVLLLGAEVWFFELDSVVVELKKYMYGTTSDL